MALQSSDRKSVAVAEHDQGHQPHTDADPAEPGFSDGYCPMPHTPNTSRRLQLRRRLSWTVSAPGAVAACKSGVKVANGSKVLQLVWD
jgi:hypothetical protein